MIALLVALHVLCGLVALAAPRLGRSVLAVAGAPLLVSAVVLLARAPGVFDGQTVEWRRTWVAGLGLQAGFRLDGFALLMALAVAIVGLVVMAYSASYFAGHPDPARTRRFAAFFTIFAGAMLGLVTASDVWTLFAFWELTSVLSFLLIGLDDGAYQNRAAAQRALLVTAAGGLAMLGGFACLVQVSGTSDLVEMLRFAGSDDLGALGEVGVGLVLVGAFTKSAQFPFHFWLPGAMAAPTPVSAYLHSATMVKAGVVLIARFAPALAELGWWRPLLVAVGGTTMLTGGVAALRRDDAKQSLAFGTVSQLGLLVVLSGFGEPDVTAAAVAMLTAHVIFKCGLFLAIGAVDHATGSRSLSKLSGVGRSMPVLAAAAGLCTLSMLGFPLLLGSAAKESALAALYESDTSWSGVALAVVVVGSTLTVAYSVRLWWGLFATKRVTDPIGVHHRAGAWLSGPVVLLGATSLVAGVFTGPIVTRLQVAAEALDDHAHVHLAVWPGFHVPLLLTAGALAAGAVVGGLVVGRPERVAFGGTAIGETAFARGYNGLLGGAKQITRVTQSGSLPVYVAIAFTVVSGVITVGLASGTAIDWSSTVVADSVLQAVVAVMSCVVALGVVLVRRRFVAVLLLGAVGQSLTVLFLIHGAPDLALTQFMVEALSIVAFLLVLRHFPHEHRPAPMWAPAALRITISVAVGAAVAWFAVAAGSTDRATDVTDTVNSLSLTEAGGANVVNMVVIDFRGVDTMFEITVFGTAALGIGNLVAGAYGAMRSPERRRMSRVGAQSMVFEVTTRMVFHLTLLLSVFMLLRGSNAPGGGFAGGLIAATAFVFRLLAGGNQGSSRRRGPSPTALIATGILLAAGPGSVALIGGGDFLETAVIDRQVGVLGHLFVPTSVVFDIGVYVLVVGVVMSVLGSLASRTEAGPTIERGTR